MFSEIKLEIAEIKRDIRASIFGDNASNIIDFTAKKVLGFDLYPEQEKWLEFAYSGIDLLSKSVVSTRNIQGARDYGKTIITTVYGVIKYLKENPTSRILIFTRESTRGKAIIKSITNKMKKLGFRIAENNSKSMRLVEQTGLDPSIHITTPFSQDWRGMHVDIVILDDIVVMQDRYSLTNRTRIKNFYKELFNVTKRIIVLGQPVDKDDLYSYLQEYKVETINSFRGSIQELDKDLDLLRKDGMSEHDIQKNYYGYLIPDDFTPFANMKVSSIDWLNSTKCVIDPAFKGGDNIGIALGLKKEDGRMLCKVWEIKGNFYEQKHRIKGILEAHNVNYVYVESNENGGALRDMKTWGFKNTVIKGYRSTKNKQMLIESRLGRALNKIILDANEYINYVLDWTPQSKQDNAVDALGALTNFLSGNKEKIKLFSK